MTLRLATRSSPLARWQAEHVAGLLRSAWGDRPLPPVLALPGQRQASPTPRGEPERVQADAHRTGG